MAALGGSLAFLTDKYLEAPKDTVSEQLKVFDKKVDIIICSQRVNIA